MMDVYQPRVNGWGDVCYCCWPFLASLMVVLICWGGGGLHISSSFASHSELPIAHGPVLRGCGGGSLG